MKFKKYGIGFSTITKFKKTYGINLNTSKLFLKNKTKNKFNLFSSQFYTGRNLFNRIKKNINFQKDTIRSYVGTRHKRNLPVRGQRTHTNATSKVKK